MEKTGNACYFTEAIMSEVHLFVDGTCREPAFGFSGI
jgi:hypothetical protein